VYNPNALEVPGSAEVRSIVSEAERYLDEKCETNPKLALRRDGLQDRVRWSEMEAKNETK
jgi:hypothetical protein